MPLSDFYRVRAFFIKSEPIIERKRKHGNLRGIAGERIDRPSNR